jgi:hypothetical protein
MKAFGDRRARREWKRKFKQEMRGWQRDLKREMRYNVHGWQQNWHDYWGRHWHPAAGAWFAVPLLTLLSVVISLAGAACIISLLATGAVFGLAFPAGVPLWGGIVILFLVFHMLTWPLRAIRHAFYFGGGPYGHPHFGFWSPFLPLLVIVGVLWYANRHVPEVDAVRRWWDNP